MVIRRSPNKVTEVTIDGIASVRRQNAKPARARPGTNVYWTEEASARYEGGLARKPYEVLVVGSRALPS